VLFQRHHGTIDRVRAEEILWAARLHPDRKRASLTPEEVDRLDEGIRACLLDATGKVRAERGGAKHYLQRPVQGTLCWAALLRGA
jgi:formamidopyrimidine-DNA glycosylase